MCHGISLPTTWLVKPKKAEDEQDDDHKADEIDDAVHGWSPREPQSTGGLFGFRQRVQENDVGPQTFPSFGGPLAATGTCSANG
jgi:hypothetical protein